MARGDGKSLTQLMENFCQKFIKEPTQRGLAARRSCFLPKTADVKASVMHKHHHIIDRIAVLMKSRNKRV